jgi:hypothetical protein
VNVDGSGERRLTAGRDPVWTPDYREIMYAAEGGIYSIVADGTLQPRKVIGNDVVLPRLPGWDSSAYYAGWVESPTVSPDGRKITFARIDPIDWDWGWERNTYIANADGRPAVAGRWLRAPDAGSRHARGLSGPGPCGRRTARASASSLTLLVARAAWSSLQSALT